MELHRATLSQMPALLTFSAITRATKSLSRNKGIITLILLFSLLNLREAYPSSRQIVRIIRNPILPTREDNLKITRNLMTRSNIIVDDMMSMNNIGKILNYKYIQYT